MENNTAGLSQFKLYTLTELEEVLGLSHKTLQRCVTDGRLQAKKICGKWRVTEEGVKNFLNAN